MIINYKGKDNCWRQTLAVFIILKEIIQKVFCV